MPQPSPKQQRSARKVQTARERLEELRRQQEAGGQTARERLELLRASGNGIDTSPVTVVSEENVRNQAINPFAQMYGGQNTATTREEREAARAGVDIFSGAPGGRFVTGLAGNEAEFADALKQSLSERYGQDIRVRKGPESGQIEFLSPETNRWTLADESGLSARDLTDAGTLLPAALGIAGEIVAGPPGAAIGAAIGEAGRRVIGNVAGVRDESVEDITKGALGVGALEGGFAYGGNWLSRAKEGIRKFFRPDAVSADFAKSILLRSEATQALADEISERTGQAFQPFAGQLADDPLLLSEQARVRNSRVEGVGYSINLQERQNDSALEGFFDVITPQGGTDPSVVGAAIQREAEAINQPISDSIRQTIVKQTEELERLTAALPNAPDEVSGRQIRERLGELRNGIKELERRFWYQAERAYGLNEDTARSTVNIPIEGPLARTVSRLEAEAAEALDPTTAAGKRSLLGGRLSVDDAGLTAEELEMIRGIAGDFNVEGSIDLHQLQVWLSALRTRERLSLANRVAGDPSSRDIARLEDALVQARNNYLSEANPELLLMIQEAEALTAVRARTFDQGLIGDILKRGAGGRYAVADANIVARTIASRDIDSIRHLTSVMSQHPAGPATLQSGMLAYYRNEVVEDGVPNAALHRRFMARNREAIEAIFGGQADQVRRLGALEEVVSANVRRLENFERQVAKRFEGRITDLAPERVAEAVFDANFSSKNVRELMQLADSAGYLEMYRRTVGDRLRRRFISSGSTINLDALQRFAGEEKEKLVSIFGPQYVSDLNKLIDATKIARRRSNANVPTRPNTETVVEALARPVAAPPLTRRGLALTRMLSFRDRARERAWAEIISSPESLHAVVLRRDQLLAEREVAEMLGVIGASALILSSEEQQ